MSPDDPIDHVPYAFGTSKYNVTDIASVHFHVTRYRKLSFMAHKSAWTFPYTSVAISCETLFCSGSLEAIISKSFCTWTEVGALRSCLSV